MSTIYAVGRTAPMTAVLGADASNAASSSAGEGSSSLLPEPSAGIGGDAVTAIAMLMVKMNEQQRADATKTEDAADRAAELDNAARVQQLEQKANDDLTGALVGGVAGLVAGGLTVASGVLPENLMPNGVANGTNWRPVAAGSSTAASALGTGTAGVYKFAADNDDAGAAKAQASADADVRQYNHANGEAESAAQSIAQVQQYLQAILQTQAATSSAATGYRG